MRSMRHQSGLGWFGLLLVLAIVGFVALIVVKTAADPENTAAEPRTIRSELQKYWDIDGIEYLSVPEAQVKRTEHGRFLSYEYEARAHLFYDISMVIASADDVPLTDVRS